MPQKANVRLSCMFPVSGEMKGSRLEAGVSD